MIEIPNLAGGSHISCPDYPDILHIGVTRLLNYGMLEARVGHG